MELTHIEIENLSISHLNMRHAKRAPDVSDILPSVRKRGILMPLLVRPNGSPTTFEIVAGRRRFYAAQAVAEEQGGIGPLPCHIMNEGDDADALEASLIENLHRHDADPMTEYETFAKLIRDGKSVEHVAATFGLTARQVEQRMALGNLLPKIREACRREELDDESVRYLTMATKSQQKEWLALFENEGKSAPTGYRLKQWLFGGNAISASVALFPLEAYPGLVTADLFGENSYFADTDLFWKHQNEAIAAERRAYLKAGWKDVVILDVGRMFETWAHEKTTKKKGGTVYVAISQRGEVTYHEGYRTRKEARSSASRAGENDNMNADTKARSEMTAQMKTYIDLHRQLAVRAAVMDAPGVALRLVIVHAMKGSGLWKISPERQHSGRNETDRSVAESRAQIDYQTRRAAVLDLLALPEGTGLVACHGDETSPLVARVLALSDEDALRVLTMVMADSLEVGSEYVEHIGKYLSVDVTNTWTPDGTFYDLLRDKRAMSGMVEEIAGKSAADANATATGKVQKQIIRDCQSGSNGRTKVEKWAPRWMEFPSGCYTERAAK